MAAACFLSRYLNGPLPYVRRHIIVNKIGGHMFQHISFLPSELSNIINIHDRSSNEYLLHLIIYGILDWSATIFILFYMLYFIHDYIFY